MLLGEVKQLENEDGILTEDVHEMLRYVRMMYDNAMEDGGDPTYAYKAANYIAFLMAYRDLDVETQEANPIPVGYMLQPGVRSAMNALQFFATKYGDDTSVKKKVAKYSERFMKRDGGKRFFHHQCDKLERYFKSKNEQKS